VTDSAAAARDEDGLSLDAAVLERQRCAVIPAMPRQAPVSKLALSESATAFCEGIATYSAAVPKSAAALRFVDQTRSPILDRGTPGRPRRRRRRRPDAESRAETAFPCCRPSRRAIWCRSD